MLFTQEGFEMTWNYKQLFIDGLVCTVSLSLLTVYPRTCAGCHATEQMASVRLLGT